MIIKKNIDKFLFICFIFTFFFSNLISRILYFNLNIIFYLLWVLCFIQSIKYAQKKVFLFIILIILFFIFFIFDPRNAMIYNLISIKEVIIPLLSILIGYKYLNENEDSFNIINYLYLIFITYGVVQEITFFASDLAKILPWDYRYIQDILQEKIATNIFQGPLLRFFGTMNSFVEYQVLSVYLCLLLILNKDKIKNKLILKLNVILLIIFLIMCLERSPILMFLITLIIWKIPFINLQKLIKIALWFIVLMILLLNNIELIKNNPYFSTAFERLENVITFNISKDEAIQEREEGNWKEAINLAISNPFGIGIGRIVGADGRKNYVAPHNSFLFFYLGYGFWGFILFLISIMILVINMLKLEKKYKYFGIGMILSFLMMGWFNLPFTGKQGIIFYLVMGYLLNIKKKSCNR